MPQKVLPSIEKYTEFAVKLQQEGFRKIRNEDFKKNFERLELSAPRKKFGRESGFYFSHPNGLTAYVWTTFVERSGVAREEDLGWVLIAEGDIALYFSHPIRRTEGFFKKLLDYASVVKNRILACPLCPACKNYMKLEKGRALGARYWACKNRKVHFRKLYRESFDVGLTSENIEFLTKERKNRSYYRKRRRDEGKSVDQARIIRKSWSVKRPENKQSMHPIGQ